MRWDRQDDGGRVSKRNVKVTVLKIFWILKSLLTSAINLSDIGSFFKTFVSHLFSSTVCWFLLFKLCISPPHYFTSRCMPSMPPNFLIRFANKRSTFHNYLFLILYWFLVLYTYLNFVSYLLFYIRHIAWCIFIRFVNKRSMFYVVSCCCLNWIQAIDAELPLI